MPRWLSSVFVVIAPQEGTKMPPAKKTARKATKKTTKSPAKKATRKAVKRKPTRTLSASQEGSCGKPHDECDGRSLPGSDQHAPEAWSKGHEGDTTACLADTRVWAKSAIGVEKVMALPQARDVQAKLGQASASSGVDLKTLEAHSSRSPSSLVRTVGSATAHCVMLGCRKTLASTSKPSQNLRPPW